MNMGFQDQFVPFVEDGSKTHTIRAGERWKVGMRADLYARPRQKGMRLIFRAPVVRVQEIEIRVIGPNTWHLDLNRNLPDRVAVYIDGQVLDEDERNLLAWRDGFRNDPALVKIGILRGCFAQMVQFWAANNGLGRNLTEWRGQIVHWDYERRRMTKEIWPKGRQHPCEYIDPVTHYDPPFGGAR